MHIGETAASFLSRKPSSFAIFTYVSCGLVDINYASLMNKVDTRTFTVFPVPRLPDSLTATMARRKLVG